MNNQKHVFFKQSEPLKFLIIFCYINSDMFWFTWNHWRTQRGEGWRPLGCIPSSPKKKREKTQIL